MFTQFFGSYLLSQGIVSQGQLKEALDYQNSIHMKLGVLAVNAGYMTAREVDNVHSMQSKMDKRFGELAIEMGYLDKNKLEKLLSTQKQGHLLLGQTLVDKKYISLEQLEQALEDYKKKYSITESKLAEFQNGSENEAIRLFFSFEGDGSKKLYQDYLFLLFKNLIRFVDSGIIPGTPENIDEASYAWAAVQEIRGEISLLTCICGDENSFVGLGSRYAGESFDSVNEMVQASVGEFLNMQNGIFLVNMSNNDMELEMDPQEIKRNMKVEGGEAGYRIPVSFPFGKLYFMIRSAGAPEE